MGAASAALTYPILDAFMARFHGWLANLISEVAGGGGEENYQGAEEEMEDEYMDRGEDSVFLVYALVEDASRQIFRDLKSVTMEVYFPDSLLIYPEPFDETDEDLYEPKGMNGVEAIIKEGRLLVQIDGWHYVKLAGMVEKGDGEVGIVEREDELRALYEVVKAIAEAGIDEDAFASYAAYKALLKIMRLHRLSVPQRLIDLLPFEDRDLRRRVREQVAEEGISQEG
ncbi:MAG: hypothetical protein ACP5HK_04635 [Acidilobus sp.]